MPALLQAALNAADHGWPVFVLGRSKRPVANCPACPKAEVDPTHDREACPCLACHGFYAATRDPQRIAAIVAAVPRGQLAVRTGAPSGLVVVDVDPAHGGTRTLFTLIQTGMLPPTARVLTGSGGLHLYYAHPGQPIPCSQSMLGPGIDVRGDGGYAVLPPSIHQGTGCPYRWAPGGWPVEEMPPALVTACAPEPTPAPSGAATDPVTLASAGGISYPDRLLDALLHRVRTAGEGRRRTTLYGVARGVAKMVAAGCLTSTDAEAVLTGAGREAGQSEREIRAAIAGGFRAEGVAL
ncbi:bifunctional DNA primase/polymerase [Catenuloplanes japonicus]|uniref:bifunctional DNA primase/polymerase n=1 Tax=Catenuloplanes japonicus TaxID=33876 RepID=UPI0005268B7D|nr:bifunctional DNA primase/polymerase [Catenuloplanes japonicus]